MLVPCGMNKSEREKYDKDHARVLVSGRKTRTRQNKHPGLRVPGANGAQAAKQKAEAKAHTDSKK